MKTKELIALLNKCDQESTVQFLLNEAFVYNNTAPKIAGFGAAASEYEIKARVMTDSDGNNPYLCIELSDSEIQERLEELSGREHEGI